MSALWTGNDESKSDPPSRIELLYQLVIAGLLGILAGLFAWILATGMGFDG